MIPTDKDKINRVIAEAMGWRYGQCKIESVRVIPWRWISPDNSRQYVSLPFNPYDSISDALEAVEFVIKKYNLIFKLEMDTTEIGMISTAWFLDERGIAVARQSSTETPQAALSLAIKQYLEKPS